MDFDSLRVKFDEERSRLSSYSERRDRIVVEIREIKKRKREDGLRRFYLQYDRLGLARFIEKLVTTFRPYGFFYENEPMIILSGSDLISAYYSWNFSVELPHDPRPRNWGSNFGINLGFRVWFGTNAEADKFDLKFSVPGIEASEGDGETSSGCSEFLGHDLVRISEEDLKDEARLVSLTLEAFQHNCRLWGCPLEEKVL